MSRKKTFNLELAEKILTYTIFALTILISIGILISVTSKSLAFWIVSISSGILFFSIFGLIIVIFLKELKK